MIFVARTHTGRIRKNNEDSFHVPAHDSPLNVMIIADGMGGHAAGEVASRIAVEEALGALAKLEEAHKESPEALIRKAVEAANNQVYRMSCTSAELNGMGTTLTTAVLSHADLWIGHVGDSRAYLWDNANLRQLTNDHTFVASLVARGFIKPEEAAKHPHRNMITKALGTREKVEPDIIRTQWRSDDILLMCSDGLSEYVSEREIIKVLSGKTSLGKKIDLLVRLALMRGGADNITVLAALNAPLSGGGTR